MNVFRHLLPLIVLATATVAAAQENEYRVGDKFQIPGGPKTVEATVVSVDGDFVEIESIAPDGQTRRQKFPAPALNELRRVAEQNRSMGGIPGFDPSGLRNDDTGLVGGRMYYGLREWTSPEGEPPYQGVMTEVGTSSLEVRMEDQSIRKIERDELSDADRDYVARMEVAAERSRKANEDAARAMQERPSGPRNGRFGRNSGRRSGIGGEDRESGGGYKTIAVDINAAKPFPDRKELRAAIPEWLPRSIADTAIPFEALPVGGSFADLSMPVLSRDGRLAAIGTGSTLDDWYQVVVFDLATGRKLVAESQGGALTPLAFSPDNTRLAVANDGEGFETGILFWTPDFAGNLLEFESGWLVDDHPEAGAFVDAERLVTHSNNKTVVYRLADARATMGGFSMPVGTVAGGSGFWLGLDLENDGSPVLLNLLAGAGHALTLPLSEKEWLGGQKALSPDGRLLAVLMENGLKVVDLVTGKVVSEIRGVTTMADRAVFVTNRYLLAGNWMFDLKLRAIVARIDSGPKPWVTFAHQPLPTVDGSLVYVHLQPAIERDATLVVSRLLTPGFLQRLEGLTSTASVSIEEGSEITLQLDGLPSDCEQAIREQIRAMGLRISSSSTIVIEAEVSRLPQETATVNMGRQGAENPKVTFQPTSATVRLLVNGDEVISKSTRFEPSSSLGGNPGETPQMAADRLCKPSPSFFVNGVIPGQVVLFSGKLPVIRVTETGFVID